MAQSFDPTAFLHPPDDPPLAPPVPDGPPFDLASLDLFRSTTGEGWDGVSGNEEEAMRTLFVF